MRDGHTHQPGEMVVGLGGIGGQRRVPKATSSLADADGPSQMIADFGGEERIASVDGVLHVAQHMSEADLMLLAQFLLAGVAIGHPYLGLMTTQHVVGVMARPARAILCSTA